MDVKNDLDSGDDMENHVRGEGPTISVSVL